MILSKVLDYQRLMIFGVLIFGIALMSFVNAQEVEDVEKRASSKGTLMLEEVSLIGSETAEMSLPASGVFLGKEDLMRHLNADVNRLLRQVPGVYLREEDGFGLFPNISIRGVSTDRSRAVTILEDGILSSPAPYSAPSAYYIPNIARMSGLEILKGSSQIRHGPHITGGVINYLSTQIPQGNLSYFKISYGSYGEMLGHLWHGDVEELKMGGRIGYVVEGFYHRADGFKTIEETPDFVSGDETGFSRVEPMVKVFWELPTERYHRLEMKYGFTDLDADETYLGLANDDFRSDPFLRYSASRFDNIQTENHRAYLRHVMKPLENLRVSTTTYLQHFKRNWMKLHQLRNFEISNLSQALLNEDALDILRGRAAGTLRIRNNARDYEIYGIQSVASLDFHTGGADHNLETGIRFHFDEVDRFQWNVDYEQSENGTIVDSTIGEMGGAGDRIQQSRALAFYTRDEIKWRKWTITPGFRFETIDQKYEQDRRRLRGGNPDFGEGRIDAFAGGMTLAYEIRESWNAFFGVHQGFSIPGPRASIRNSLNEETSLNFEIGSRFADHDRGLRLDAILFQTELNDLIVGGNIGGGGSANTENVGDISSMGLELTIGYDLGKMAGWAIRTPFEFGLTLTDARLEGDARNEDPESLFEGGRDGAKVPYIPDYQIHSQLGLEYGRGSAYFSVSYVPSTFTSASNTKENLRSDGTADARVGKTDSYFLADLSLRYRLKDRTTIFGGIRNLFDRKYIASRHPHGPRPGLPRFFNAGFEVYF